MSKERVDLENKIQKHSTRKIPQTRTPTFVFDFYDFCGTSSLSPNSLKNASETRLMECGEKADGFDDEMRWGTRRVKITC